MIFDFRGHEMQIIDAAGNPHYMVRECDTLTGRIVRLNTDREGKPFIAADGKGAHEIEYTAPAPLLLKPKEADETLYTCHLKCPLCRGPHAIGVALNGVRSQVHSCDCGARISVAVQP